MPVTIFDCGIDPGACYSLRLLVYRYHNNGTLSLLWQKDVAGPNNSLLTPWPVAAFDFDGDGAAELVYLDDQKLSILNGRDGTTLFEMGVNRTVDQNNARYPIIADVDNDGVAEIIVPTEENQPAGAPPRRGVLVLGDTSGNWRPARRIWNQWQYSITNINEDGSVPRVPRNNWQVFNNHRTQTTQDGVEPFGAPDLTVSKVEIDTQHCPASLDITARIGNGGNLHAPAGLSVTFYTGDPAAGGTVFGMRTTTRALYPGDSEDVTLAWSGLAPGQVFVTVNESHPGSPISSLNLERLPNTWAQGSGLCGGCSVEHNFKAYWGIAGQSGTIWLEKRFGANSISTNPIFYEVHFPFPVNATAVTIHNTSGRSTNAGFLSGTLTFSNGFSIPLPLNASGEGTVAFPEQSNITWVRLTASSTKPGGASVSEFSVAGSYIEPQFRINEGEGRLGNNIAASGPGIPACGTATNQPPQIISAPPLTARIDVAYTYPVQTFDPNNDPLAFALTEAPAGMVISATGQLTWTPTDTQTGDFPVTVQVSDGQGGTATQSFTISVPLPPSPNQPPQITSTASPTVTVGQTYRYDVTATDPDGDVVVFALLQAPAGAAIEPLTGGLSWTPTAAALGSQFFTVAAHDGKGDSTLQSFAVAVLPVTTPLPALAQDRDGDGFDETVDCDDNNPNVNPGRTEIPGNGIDDDCNPATPDILPTAALTCALVTDKRSYTSHALAELTTTIQSLSANLDITGLQAELTVRDPGGQSVLATTFPVNTLAPHALSKSTAAFSTETSAPGTYHATVILHFGSAEACQAQATFALLASDVAGNALTGSITTEPTAITQGQNATFSYQVSNVGNVDLPALSLEILVARSDNATVVRTFTEQHSLSKGASFTNQQTFASSGVAGGEYLVILRGGQNTQRVPLASAPLRITATNQGPLAHAGSNQSVLFGTIVQLDGSASMDPDHGPAPLSFTWHVASPPAYSALTDANITGATTALASFTPDVRGDFTLALTVSDGALFATAMVVIHVLNNPPVANAGQDRDVQTGTLVMLDGSNSFDPDGDMITYDWSIDWSLTAKPTTSALTNNDMSGRTTPKPGSVSL